MDKVYKTLYRYGEDEIIINKSRFIGYAKPVETEEEALEFIEEISIKHRDATHNVYAYVIGETSNIQRFSDDGEPSGTAGIPALEVLKKEDLRNTVVVVTRYFGGIKLGGGGLIRAYTKGAKIAIDAAVIIDMVEHTKVKIRVDYTTYGRIENFLITEGYLVEDTVYDDAVNIYVLIRYDFLEEFENIMTELTSGTAEISRLDDEYVPMKNGDKYIE